MDTIYRPHNLGIAFQGEGRSFFIIIIGVNGRENGARIGDPALGGRGRGGDGGV